MNDNIAQSIRENYDRLADEYARKLFNELQHKPLDRELLNRFASHISEWVNSLWRRRLRQRFERGVSQAPRRIEVAAIKCDQCACGFEDRVRLIRQRLTAGVRKSRGQPANRFELADQYGGRRRRGLTDLVERELGEAL